MFDCVVNVSILVCLSVLIYECSSKKWAKTEDISEGKMAVIIFFYSVFIQNSYNEVTVPEMWWH